MTNVCVLAEAHSLYPLTSHSLYPTQAAHSLYPTQARRQGLGSRLMDLAEARSLYASPSPYPYP